MPHASLRTRSFNLDIEIRTSNVYLTFMTEKQIVGAIAGDGQANRHDTKERLLEAAALIFAEKGFRDATVQSICQAADANVAAINYHFGNKESLYIEVWRSVAEAMKKSYLEPVGQIVDPEDRLRQIIRNRIEQTFDEGPAGHLRKLAFREMGAPTEAHEQITATFLRPFRDLLTRTVAEILDVDEQSPIAHRCAFSLHSQLIFLNVLRMRDRLHHLEFLTGSSKNPDREEIEALTEHICTFVLGGIKTITNTYDKEP